jgi:serine/threonine protein kinase
MSRDLKPDNLGFNASDELKLFDFGLAKRLEPSIQTDNDLYLLTGNTGR